jgi:hypothetical protein
MARRLVTELAGAMVSDRLNRCQRALDLYRGACFADPSTRLLYEAIVELKKAIEKGADKRH